MPAILKLLRKTLIPIKVTFFFSALVFWGLAIYDGSNLPYVVIAQTVWMLVSSTASYFLVGSDDEDIFNRPDLLLWLLNFWIIVIVAGLAWGVFWGIGTFFAMLALITIGSSISSFFATRFSKLTVPTLH